MLSKTTIDQMVKAYNSGTSTETLAKLYNRNPGTIRYHLRRGGAKIRKSGKVSVLTDEQKEEIRARYTNYYCICCRQAMRPKQLSIAAEYGVSAEVIHYVLKNHR